MRLHTQDSGQALLELSAGFTILVVFVLGIVDFGQAVYDAEVMRNLSGQSSSMASRPVVSLSSTASSVVTQAPSAMNLGGQGCVILTVVTNNGSSLQVTDQASQCAITGVSSRIGCVQGQSGCNTSTPVIPATAMTALRSEPTGSSLYITEIFYNYTANTPITQFLQGSALPTQLYSVAYY
jgi:Flp pilus assembly protein TadG